jgi:LysR family transcriptional regulator, hydrogen peroxide-inducible genes activator
VEGARQAPAGRLAIGCIPTLLPYFLAPRLTAFSRQYSEVEVELVEETTARLIERLQGGRLDVVLAGLPVRNRDLLCRELFREPLLLAVAPGHRLAEAAEVALGELEGERVLLLKEGHCLRSDALSACRRARAHPGSQFESDHLESIFPLVAAGFGVSLVPQMAARQRGDCSFLGVRPQAERRVGYLRLRAHHPSAAQQAFLRWLKAVAPPASRDGQPHTRAAHGSAALL